MNDSLRSRIVPPDKALTRAEKIEAVVRAAFDPAEFDAFYGGQRAPLPAGCVDDSAPWRMRMVEDTPNHWVSVPTLDSERGPCRNCRRTFDGCVNANGDHWLPCCSQCDHE